MLLILAAGMFPLQAVLGHGRVASRLGDRASSSSWRRGDVAHRDRSRAACAGRSWASRASCCIGLWAYHFPKIGVEFMPPLNEGTVMDMPITVPRASVTQAADDLKARDALLRGFPEVESVIGKAGRADTPTDPAPLDMVETFVNYPAERAVAQAGHEVRRRRAADAARAWRRWRSGAIVRNAGGADDRDGLINDAAMNALGRFDETHARAGPAALPRFRARAGAGADALRRRRTPSAASQARATLHWPKGAMDETERDRRAGERADPAITAAGWRRTRPWKT